MVCAELNVSEALRAIQCVYFPYISNGLFSLVPFV